MSQAIFDPTHFDVDQGRPINLLDLPHELLEQIFSELILAWDLETFARRRATAIVDDQPYSYPPDYVRRNPKYSALSVKFVCTELFDLATELEDRADLPSDALRYFAGTYLAQGRIILDKDDSVPLERLYPIEWEISMSPPRLAPIFKAVRTLDLTTAFEPNRPIDLGEYFPELQTILIAYSALLPSYRTEPACQLFLHTQQAKAKKPRDDLQLFASNWYFKLRSHRARLLLVRAFGHRHNEVGDCEHLQLRILELKHDRATDSKIILLRHGQGICVKVRPLTNIEWGHSIPQWRDKLRRTSRHHYRELLESAIQTDPSGLKGSY